MSLNKTQLITDIEAAFTAARATTTNPITAANTFASSLATAIDNYVKGADVNYTTATLLSASPGSPVTGAGVSIATLT